MDKFKNMLSYLLIFAITFYILPLLGKVIGNFMFILLILIPLICFITSLLYSLKNGLNLVFSFIVGVLFIPTIVTYYNSSAWVYIIGYTIISLTGNLIGGFFRKKAK